MKLYYRTEGKGKPLIILHGLFGSSDNWLTLGRELANHRKVYLVDQRNHGQSPHSDTFTYEAMAEDLAQFIEEQQIEMPIILGHSMGGKTAMKFAIEHPEKLEKLIVADIAPKAYPIHHDQILEGLMSLDLENLKSRKEADEQLARFVPQLGVRQFLLKNLARGPQGFEWKVNLPVLNRDIENVVVPLDENASFNKPTLFIRGDQSDYIQDEDEALIAQIFQNYRLKTIPGAGHWLHAEKPQEFLELVNEFLD
jgi:esterase